MLPLADPFGRRFSYLRLSVTEVCNFRCVYCLPDGWRKTGPSHFLDLDEIGRLTGAFAELGLTKVRITGGEPAARADLTEIIATVAATPGVSKVALTTNGWNLAQKAEAWRRAGLTHLNVSVDTLNAEAFARLTGHDRLGEILDGVDAAIALGYGPVKINAVLMRETAPAAFEDFARYVADRPVSVRLIELMRTGDNAELFAAQHLSGVVLKDWLVQHGWSPRARGADDGPAVEYGREDVKGQLGLIAPYAPGFCEGCNRLRVTARGKLRVCLFGDAGVDLRDLLQSEADRPALIARIRAGLGEKPAGHRLHKNDPGATRRLADVGG